MALSSNASFHATEIPLLTRFLIVVGRRLRLVATRWRFPQASFAGKCVVRARFVLRQGKNAQVKFGQGCVLDNDLTIECLGELSVGARVIFGHHCTVAARERIEIGDDCMIAELVSIRDHDHAFDNSSEVYREQGFVCAPVHIGRNVWLGGKVTICKGVTIGDNAVIGANAVVTKNIPANCIAGGVPARIIKSLPLRGQN